MAQNHPPGPNTGFRYEASGAMTLLSSLNFNSQTITNLTMGTATGTALTLTGNLTAGNLVTAGLASVTGNVAAGNFTSAGLASITGNVAGGNITSAGAAVITGNVTGGNLTTAGEAQFADGNASGNMVLSSSANTAFQITNPNDIANADSVGTAGSICWNSGNLYVCVAANTWERIETNATGWA